MHGSLHLKLEVSCLTGLFSGFLKWIPQTWHTLPRQGQTEEGNCWAHCFSWFPRVLWLCHPLSPTQERKGQHLTCGFLVSHSSHLTLCPNISLYYFKYNLFYLYKTFPILLSSNLTFLIWCWAAGCHLWAVPAQSHLQHLPLHFNKSIFTRFPMLLLTLGRPQTQLCHSSPLTPYLIFFFV